MIKDDTIIIIFSFVKVLVNRLTEANVAFGHNMARKSNSYYYEIQTHTFATILREFTLDL